MIDAAPEMTPLGWVTRLSRADGVTAATQTRRCAASAASGLRSRLQRHSDHPHLPGALRGPGQTERPGACP